MRFINFLFVMMISSAFFISAAQAEDPSGRRSIGHIREMIFDSIVRINSNPEIFIVADRGRIYRRSGNAQLWQEIPSGVREPLFSVTFADSKNGWISGASGLIIHTRDGGSSWTLQQTPKDSHLFTVHFADALHGCAAGDWGTILRTGDGGQTWEDVSLPEDVVLYGIYMADADTGWLVGEFGRIYHTGDGGRSWEETPAVAFQSLFCVDVDGDTIVAAGLDGEIVHSHDGGSSWAPSVNKFPKSLYGISIRGPNGWAVGDTGVVVKTIDGGKTWTRADVKDEPSVLWDRRGHSFLLQFSPGTPCREVFE